MSLTPCLPQITLFPYPGSELFFPSPLGRPTELLMAARLETGAVRGLAARIPRNEETALRVGTY